MEVLYAFFTYRTDSRHILISPIVFQRTHNKILFVFVLSLPNSGQFVNKTILLYILP